MSAFHAVYNPSLASYDGGFIEEVCWTYSFRDNGMKSIFKWDKKSGSSSRSHRLGSGMCAWSLLVAAAFILWPTILLSKTSHAAETALVETESIPYSIVIKDKVVLKQGTIFLRDLVDKVSKDEVLPESLLNVDIGPAPRPGEELKMPRATLLTRLRSRIPGFDSIDWNLPRMLTLERAAHVLSLEEVEASLRRYVDAHFPLHYANLEVEDVHYNGPYSIPVGKTVLRFGPDQYIFPGRVSLSMVVSVDGEEILRTQVRARVSADVRVLMTRRALRKGDIVDRDDLDSVVVRMDSDGRGLIADVMDAIGKEVRKPIAEKALLKDSMLEAPPLIRRGDPVVVMVQTRNLTVTSTGEARSDGRPGDVVRVITNMSRKELKGRVTESGTILIPYLGAGGLGAIPSRRR